jgi:hypothetical protein
MGSKRPAWGHWFSRRRHVGVHLGIFVRCYPTCREAARRHYSEHVTILCPKHRMCTKTR